MSTTIPAGQGIVLTATFTTPAGIPEAPSAGNLDVTDPTGNVTTYPLASLATSLVGTYEKTIAPILPGRWTYAFIATEGVIAAVTGAFNVAPEDWTPTVEEVGRKLRARTIDKNGTERGTFTSETGSTDRLTRPSAEEVASIIEEETGALQGFVGWDMPPTLWSLAKSAALSRIAARVELDYFPEQIQSGRSPYEQYVADRDREEGRLISAVRNMSGAGESGGVAIGSILTSPQAAIDSLTVTPVGNVIPDIDLSPGWPVGGAAGTIV